jgi:hypothetical protein
MSADISLMASVFSGNWTVFLELKGIRKKQGDASQLKKKN